MNMFQPMKVLGTFALEERKLHRCDSSMERKFLDFSLLESECSTERKFHGSESTLCRLFAPGKKSADLGTKSPDTQYRNVACGRRTVLK